VLGVRVSRGSNISPHTCKPQFSPCNTHANLHTGTHVAHHARLVPTLGAPRVGTNVATQAILVPLPMLAQMLHPCNTRATSNVGTNVAPHAKPMPTLDLARMLQHKQNTCQLLSCKSRANSYPQVIHRLPHAKLVPTLRPSKTRANFRHAKVVPMLSRGRGLTCVDNCSSHSGTKKVKTRKKEP